MRKALKILTGVGIGFAIYFFYRLFKRPKFGSVFFIVTDVSLGLPIAGAHILLNSYSDFTNEYGNIGFSIPWGIYNCVIEKEGFESVQYTIDIASGVSTIGIQLKPLSPPPPPPPPLGETFTIILYYIYHYLADYDANWREKIKPGLELGLTRFANYMGGKQIEYTFGTEFKTTAIIGNSKNLSTTEVDKAVKEMCEQGLVDDSYTALIFVFANSKDALLYNYQSPFYMSDRTFFIEGQETLIEHEFFHSFGLPDHMQPFKNPEYANCIMGNLYLGEVKLCSECSLKAKWENYRKKSTCT